MIIKLKDQAVGFVCENTGSGWTYTLTSQLGNLLREAESRFGPRDATYTILGIEFGGDRPSLWYPGDCKHVSVKLSKSASQDYQQAYFQLAHEVVHLISPTGTANANVLEEGLAHIFSLEMTKAKGLNYRGEIPAYDDAADHVNVMLASNSNIIRDIRALEPCLAKIQPEHLLEFVPNGDVGLFQRLCSPFAG
jgi:hypothetical protein